MDRQMGLKNGRVGQICLIHDEPKHQITNPEFVELANGNIEIYEVI